jgi:hypothetical protein
VFAGALGYAVELSLLPANPLDRIQWKASAVAETVDRRSVASPAQARSLLKGHCCVMSSPGSFEA